MYNEAYSKIVIGSWIYKIEITINSLSFTIAIYCISQCNDILLLMSRNIFGYTVWNDKMIEFCLFDYSIFDTKK